MYLFKKRKEKYIGKVGYVIGLPKAAGSIQWGEGSYSDVEILHS